MTKRARLLLERIKEQPRAHQRAADSALSRSTTKYTKIFTAHFCNGLFCAQFFDYLFWLWLYIFVHLIKMTIYLNTQKNIAQIRVHKRRPINWNDRRSRECLCFYSAIFHLTIAKFLTFAYNFRTVGSSVMKFWQQFEINELYVCTKFRGNRLCDFGFRTRKPPRKFGLKSGLSQKRLKYSKKYFLWLYILRYPFIPTNPLLAAMRFFSFFFLPKFCTLFFS